MLCGIRLRIAIRRPGAQIIPLRKPSSTRASADIAAGSQELSPQDSAAHMSPIARLAGVHSVLGKAMIKKGSVTAQGAFLKAHNDTCHAQ